MQPQTLFIGIKTYEQGLAVAALIRLFDDTADILLHEAKIGNGWSVTAHTCVPEQKTKELRQHIRETGALLTFREIDRP